MREVYLLTFHWGWLSSGCYTQLRYEQGNGYLKYIGTLTPDYFSRLAFSHAGWLFDNATEPDIQRVPGQELEPTLHVAPFNGAEIAEWRAAVAEGRLEPVTYYYAPLVAEQVTGEMLIRAIRYTREIFERELGVPPIALTSHDPFTMMNWGTAQQVQLAALTGHRVLMGGLQGMVVAPDGTRLPCIGGTLQRYGLETMSSPMIEALANNQQAAFTFATEMHWHHRTNPFEWALRQVSVRFRDIRFIPAGIEEWVNHVQDWPEVPAAGLGSKGWNGGGPDQLQLSSLIRSCEMLLPGIEALQALRPGGGQSEQVKSYWKRALILNDNHIRWLVHDHKRIYLPAAQALLADVRSCAQDTLETLSAPVQSHVPRLVVWNLLGRERTAAAETEIELPPGSGWVSLRSPGDERPPTQVIPLEWGPDGDLRRARLLWVARDLPSWGHRAYDLVFSAGSRNEPEGNPSAPLVLENARLRATFAPNGELVSLQNKRDGQTIRGGNRLLNLIPRPVQQEYTVKGGAALADQGGDQNGCFSASAEVVLPEVASYNLNLDEMHGCLILVEVDVIGRDGSNLAPTRRFPVINLHWMGAPQRYTAARTIPLGELASGTRLRVTLWFITEGKSVIGAGAITSQRHNLPIAEWKLHWVYRLAVVPGEATSAEVLEQGPVRQRLRFRGKLPQCSYETTATLMGPKSQSRIDFETRFTFNEPTQTGMPTPSMPVEVGSYLGSNNERPYIPGLMVTFPVPGNPEMLVDAPYAFRDPQRPVYSGIVQRSWLADATEPVENFWWGLSPFTALKSVAVRGWGGLVAHGTPHYFLWRGLEEPQETSLGISFGASLIHPRTVSKRVDPHSDWFEFGRGPGYADFQDGTAVYDFNHPNGRYTFRYSISLEDDPIDLTYEADDTAVPFWVIMLPGKEGAEPLSAARSWMNIDSNHLFLTGCEWLHSDGDHDVVRVRLSEQSGRETTCHLECLRAIESIAPGLLPIEHSLVDPHKVRLVMPANGVRELLLTLRRDKPYSDTAQE